MNRLWKIAFVLASFSWLMACTSSTIVACPEVPVWSQSDQTGLLHEIESKSNGHKFSEVYPYTYRAMKEYQTMRITARPCAIGEHHMVDNLPSFPPQKY
jgi:hypothetical protein